MGILDSIKKIADPLDIVGTVTGQNAAEAAREGAQAQVAASREAMELLRADLAPFRDLGVNIAQGNLLDLATNQQAQADFITNNPFFTSLLNQSNANTLAGAAATGRLGSSGTRQELQQNALLLGNDLLNQAINRQLPLLSQGQNAAAQAGSSSADLLTGMGNARAAGLIGASNAEAQGMQNLLQLAALAGGASDKKLKKNIKKIGEWKGLNIYRWDWKDGRDSYNRGVIAQEVQEKFPHLVREQEGYLAVDYVGLARAA